MPRVMMLLLLVVLAALLASGCSSDSNSPTNNNNDDPVEDLIPPAAPVNLSAQYWQNQITVAWVENSELDLNGYNVYRSHNGSGYELLDSCSQAQYVDTVGGRDLENLAYRITALDTSGNESAYSQTVMITFSGSGPEFEELDQPE